MQPDATPGTRSRRSLAPALLAVCALAALGAPARSNGTSGPGEGDAADFKTLEAELRRTSKQYRRRVQSVLSDARSRTKSANRSFSRRMRRSSPEERQAEVDRWREELGDAAKDWGETSYEEYLYLQQLRGAVRDDSLGPDCVTVFGPGIGDAWDETDLSDDQRRAVAQQKVARGLRQSQRVGRRHGEHVTTLTPRFDVPDTDPLHHGLTADAEVLSLLGFGDGSVTVGVGMLPRPNDTELIVEVWNLQGEVQRRRLVLPPGEFFGTFEFELEPGPYVFDVLHARGDEDLLVDTVRFTVGDGQSGVDARSRERRRQLLRLKHQVVSLSTDYGSLARVLNQRLIELDHKLRDGKIDESEWAAQVSEYLDAVSEDFRQEIDDTARRWYDEGRRVLDEGETAPEGGAGFGPGTPEWNDAEDKASRRAGSAIRGVRRGLRRSQRRYRRQGREMSFLVPDPTFDEAYAIQWDELDPRPEASFTHVLGFDTGAVDTGFAVNTFVPDYEDAHTLVATGADGWTDSWPVTVEPGRATARAQFDVPEGGRYQFEIVFEGPSGPPLTLDRITFTVPELFDGAPARGLSDPGSPGLVIRIGGGPVETFEVVLDAMIVIDPVDDTIQDFSTFFQPQVGDGSIVFGAFDHTGGIPITDNGEIVLESGGVGRPTMTYDPSGGGFDDVVVFDPSRPFVFELSVPPDLSSLPRGEHEIEIELSGSGSVMRESGGGIDTVNVRCRIPRVMVLRSREP